MPTTITFVNIQANNVIQYRKINACQPVTDLAICYLTLLPATLQVHYIIEMKIFSHKLFIVTLHVDITH